MKWSELGKPIDLMQISQDIVKGMEQSKQAMIDEGIWTDETTLKEWANYAGQHVIINEKDFNAKEEKA